MLEGSSDTVYLGTTGLIVTRADAPSWGRALASAGMSGYAGNLCWQPFGYSMGATGQSQLNVCMWVCSQAKLGGLEVVIDVAEFDEQWQRVAGQQFSMQNTLFVPHDFAVSKSYYIFFYSDTTFELVSHSLPDDSFPP